MTGTASVARGVVGVAAATALLFAAALAFPSFRTPVLVASLVAIPLVVVVGWAATARAERRRATMTLERFHSALVGVATDPDLETTLASIAHGARRAVDGKFVSVLVRDAEGVMQGALEGDHDPDPKERSAEIIQRILAEPERSPSGLALVTGEPVVVRDVRTDARFSHWADESTRQGFTSTIAVPLKGARGVIGVLATYLASPSLVTDDAVRILVAYAEHAALVVQRAMAWEWERATAQRLAEADSLRTDLVATVSHELRTPLTAVHGFTETLIRHWHRFDDRERLEMLDRVLANSRELGRLIDQVLDYSHLAAGVVSVEPRPMRLDEAIREWADDRRAIAGSHQLVLEVEPVVVMASDDALDRILANLISNAAKYSPAGTTIWVRGVVEEGRAVVSVIDEGPGVPPEDRHRIFERFERGSHARSNVRGSGIGLAIVSRYVELLGGSVWVEPDPGPGAVFSFTLPSTTADVPAGDVSGVRPGAR